MTLEDRLEQLANRTPPRDPDKVFASARAQIDEKRAAQHSRRFRVLAAAAVVAVLALAAGGSALMLHDGRETVTVAGPGEQNGEPDQGAAVSAAVDDLGPVVASVSPLSASEQGWLEHTVTLTNTDSKYVYLNDFRAGTLLGDREVAVATDGCGYGSSGDQPVTMGCYTDHRPVTIGPGGTHTFTVTLWRELSGMNPVGDGPYEWRLSIVHSDVPFGDRDQTGTTGTLTLTYENLAADRTGPARQTTRLTVPESGAPADQPADGTPGHMADERGGLDDLSQEAAEIIVSDFLRLADEPSPEAVERLPFAEEVRLGLGSDLHQARSRSQLADPARWVIDQEMFRAYSGPFSALEMAANAQSTVVTVGEHLHCASPPMLPPVDVADLARVSVQPDPDTIDSCNQWWTVDLYVNETGQIEAVTLDLYEP